MTTSTSTMSDMPFDDAIDVGSIQYRLHPLDVGFDLRETGHAVQIARTDDPLRVSYPDRQGARRVLDGPQAEVIRRLEALGFAVLLA